MKLTRSFSFRMVATTVIAIILSISIAMLLIFMQYRHHMQELDGTHTLHAFSEVETDLMKLLNDANSMALKIQQSKIVSAYLFNNYESDIEKVVAKRDMMAALSEELSEDSGLYGVLFFREDASMVGATLPWRFSFETTQHPFFETGNLDYVPIGQDVIWLGAYPLSEFTLRENYQAEEGNILIIGANRMRYKYNAQNQDTIVLLTAVSISSLEKLYTYLENESSDIYLLDKNGCQISGPDKSHLGEQPSFAASLPANEAYGSFEFKNAHGTDLVIYKLLPDLGWFLAKTVSA